MAIFSKFNYKGCSLCRDKGYIEFNCDSSGLKRRTRCECSEVETEEYKKAKSKLEKREAKFYNKPSEKTKKKLEKAKKKLSKFVDNNSECNSYDNSVSRSW